MPLLLKVDRGEVELQDGHYVYAENGRDTVYREWKDAPENVTELIDQGNALFDRIANQIVDR